MNPNAIFVLHGSSQMFVFPNAGKWACVSTCASADQLYFYYYTFQLSLSNAFTKLYYRGLFYQHTSGIGGIIFCIRCRQIKGAYTWEFHSSCLSLSFSLILSVSSVLSACALTSRITVQFTYTIFVYKMNWKLCNRESSSLLL